MLVINGECFQILFIICKFLAFNKNVMSGWHWSISCFFMLQFLSRLCILHKHVKSEWTKTNCTTLHTNTYILMSDSQDMWKPAEKHDERWCTYLRLLYREMYRAMIFYSWLHVLGQEGKEQLEVSEWCFFSCFHPCVSVMACLCVSLRERRMEREREKEMMLSSELWFVVLVICLVKFCNQTLQKFFDRPITRST